MKNVLKLNPLSKRITGTTKDYSLFLTVEGNRAINQKHVAKLVDSMQTHGNISAIICRQIEKEKEIFYEIMDGQHRVEAAKICNLPIEYDCWDITNRGMIALNENQKNWTLDDYVNFGVADGLNDYIILSKYRESSGMALTALIEIFGGNKIDPERKKEGEGNTRRQFKEMGVRYDTFKRLTWKIPNLERSESILNMLQDFYTKFNVQHWKNHRFVSAFITVLNSGNYDHERMLSQMDKGVKLTRQQKQGDFIANFEHVYNHQFSSIKRTVFKR